MLPSPPGSSGIIHLVSDDQLYVWPQNENPICQ